MGQQKTRNSEYMAFTCIVQQLLWINKFLDEVGLSQERPGMVRADNNGAIATMKNDKSHQHTKHIDIKYHFIKEQVATNTIDFIYVPSSQNLTDILMKPLTCDGILKCCQGLGLID